MTGATIRPLVAAALMAFGTAVPAATTGTYSVDTRGIDLTTATGREMLERRVERTIATVCGTPVLFSRAEAAALRDCRDATRAEVQPRVQALLSRTSVAER